MDSFDKEREQRVAPGTVFHGRYEVVARLGEGGFSHVYQGRQKTTGQDVAIKVLQPRWAEDGTQLARFRREIELCARLHHPNIVRLLDTGQTEDGLVFTVFELVPGRSLGQVLAEEGRLSPREAVYLMGQVLDALAYAHQRGVLHRDLKPQNIMIAAAGVRRNALVLDFGLGTLTEEAMRSDQVRLTLSHEAMGTPAYAAPELLRGEEASVRSDMYAWALILLECLTGQRIMDGRTLQEVLHKQLSAEAIAVPVVVRGGWLGQLLDRVLSKEAAARDVVAEELLHALEAWRPDGWDEGEEHAVQQAAEQRPDATSVPLSEGGRRQLTTLSLALTIGGQGLENRDGEDVDRMLVAQHEACLRLARRFEAQVGGVLGERALLYFGYPQAREDDARRAARAALALAHELVRRAEELATRHRLTLQWRIGLHTGLVVEEEASRSSRRSTLWGRVGVTPQVAMRLEALAEPGDILVSEDTARLLGTRFELEQVSTHLVPGRARPMAVLRLGEELRGEHTPTPLDWQQRPMSGRSQELELLRIRWQQACQGQGQVLLVVGEPGIGKSRLVRELVRIAQGGSHTWLECRCSPENSQSVLQPVVDMLGRLLRGSRDGSSPYHSLEELVDRLGLEKAEMVPLLAALLGLPVPERYPAPQAPPQRLKEMTKGAIISLMGAMAEQQPLMLVIEDLHWADPSTLELLGNLAEEAATQSICLMATVRPELALSWSGSHVLQVQLGRLEATQVGQMVKDLAGGRTLPPEVLTQVVQRADGVPLFVEELTRMIIESGVLEERPEGWRLATPISALEVPSTLRELLMARLDRLGAAKETAQLASALGREFSSDVLRAISGREEAALQKDLSTLVSSGVVFRRRGVRGVTYFFKHALVRDTAYESLSKSARRQVHARIATALEERFPELVENRPELLAHHHAGADQKRKALDYAQRAATSALRRSANAEALVQANEALTWLGAVEDERERSRIELDLNGIALPALMATRGWMDEAIRTKVERSQKIIDFLGDSPHTAPTMWALQLYYHTRGQRLNARTITDRIVALAGDDADRQIHPLAVLSSCLWVEGELKQAEALCHRVMQMYDPERNRDLAHMYGLDSRMLAETVLASLEWLKGQPDQALARQKQCEQHAKQLQHAQTLGVAYAYSLCLHQQRREPQELLAVAEVARELAERQGLVPQIAYIALMVAWAKQDLESQRRILETWKSMGFEGGLTYQAALLMEVELALGHHDQALKVAQEWIGRGRSSGEKYYIAELLRLQGVCLYRMGAGLKAAEACFREALEVAQSQGAHMLELRAAVSFGQALRSEGRPADVRRVVSEPLGKIQGGQGLADLVEARELVDWSTQGSL